jgi:hypothetical protein
VVVVVSVAGPAVGWRGTGGFGVGGGGGPTPDHPRGWGRGGGGSAPRRRRHCLGVWDGGPRLRSYAICVWREGSNAAGSRVITGDGPRWNGLLWQQNSALLSVMYPSLSLGAWRCILKTSPVVLSFLVAPIIQIIIVESDSLSSHTSHQLTHPIYYDMLLLSQNSHTSHVSLHYSHENGLS